MPTIIYQHRNIWLVAYRKSMPNTTKKASLNRTLDGCDDSLIKRPKSTRVYEAQFKM